MERLRLGLLAAILACCTHTLPARADLPTIRIWPDVVPPCDGTLQACVDASGPGDQIRIATNDPIAETISFSKSLTLVAQSGYSPVFSSGGITASTASSGDQTIRVEGLGFDQSIVTLVQASTGQATFQVRDNTFHDGGTIGLGSNVPGAGPISFEVSGNTLTEVTGAGIQLNSVTTTMTGSITDNSILTSAGGNFAIEVGANVTADVLRNSVSGLSAGIGVTGTSSVRIVDNLLLGPQVPPDPGSGIDGIRVGGPTTTIVNNTIAHWDNGIVLDDGPQHDAVLDCQIANNLITDDRIGIDNAADVDDPNAVVSYVANLFFANSFDVARTGVPITIVDADPLYAGAGDFHVQPGSPAIDAGDDASVPLDVTTDLDGAPRIQGSHVDIGAFEAPEPARRAGEQAALGALAVCGVAVRGRAGALRRR